MTDLRILLFPPRCASCGKLLDWQSDGGAPSGALCEDCRAEWNSARLETCGICGKPVCLCACMPDAMTRAGCAAFYKVVYYAHGKRGPIPNRVIYHIKRNREKRTPLFLANALLPALQKSARDGVASPSDTVLTFVPRRHAALAEFGVDQAKLLSQSLAQLSGIAMLPLLCRRRVPQREQKHLSFAERRKNALASYGLIGKVDLRGKTVILVDDIVTTGSSMAACTRLLRRAGCAQVFCLAVASDDANQNLPEK